MEKTTGRKGGSKKSPEWGTCAYISPEGNDGRGHTHDCVELLYFQFLRLVITVLPNMCGAHIPSLEILPVSIDN